jgi:L-threonylcarbamoyladenylate synthase
VEESPPANQPLPSPGLLPRHYAPHLPLRVRPSHELESPPGNVVVIRLSEAVRPLPPALPADPRGYAAGLYSALRWAESVEGASEIWLESPPTGPEWDAIWDRLRRASRSKGHE